MAPLARGGGGGGGGIWNGVLLCRAFYAISGIPTYLYGRPQIYGVGDVNIWGPQILTGPPVTKYTVHTSPFIISRGPT